MAVELELIRVENLLHPEGIAALYRPVLQRDISDDGHLLVQQHARVVLALARNKDESLAKRKQLRCSRARADALGDLGAQIEAVQVAEGGISGGIVDPMDPTGHEGGLRQGLREGRHLEFLKVGG